MKRSDFINFLLLIAVMAFMVSCQKATSHEHSIENINPLDDEVLLTRDDIPLFQACWDEWGRADRDCGGWGLCNFNSCWLWHDDFPCCSEIEHAGTGYIYDDGNNNGELIIELNATKPSHAAAILSVEPLVIYSGITIPTSVTGYSTITLSAGSYQLDSNVGSSGGYKVSVVFNN